MGEGGHPGGRAQSDAEQWGEHAKHRSKDEGEHEDYRTDCERERQRQPLVDPTVDLVVRHASTRIAGCGSGREVDAADNVGRLSVPRLAGARGPAVPGERQKQRLAVMTWSRGKADLNQRI